MRIEEKPLTCLLVFKYYGRRQKERSMPLDKQDMEKIEKTFGRYVKIIDEHHSAQNRPMVEMQRAQGEKIDALYEMVARNTEDITVIKSDVSFIKQELKQKVDRDEFNTLERRVIFLENKLKRA